MQRCIFPLQMRSVSKPQPAGRSMIKTDRAYNSGAPNAFLWTATKSPAAVPSSCGGTTCRERNRLTFVQHLLPRQRTGEALCGRTVKSHAIFGILQEQRRPTVCVFFAFLPFRILCPPLSLTEKFGRLPCPPIL